MLRYLKTNKAQAVIGEYVLVFFLAIGMVTAMTIYFKRAVQARIHGARDVMLDIFRKTLDGITAVGTSSETAPPKDAK